MASIILSISRKALVQEINACLGVVRYSMGAKPPLESEPSRKKGPGKFTVSDCSGFVRWLLWRASGGTVKLPMGSWQQRKWFQDRRFMEIPYLDCSKKDGRLRIAFFNPTKNRAGHAWLCVSGMTIECYGCYGVGRRSWDKAVLKSQVQYCFELTPPI